MKVTTVLILTFLCTVFAAVVEIREPSSSSLDNIELVDAFAIVSTVYDYRLALGKCGLSKTEVEFKLCMSSQRVLEHQIIPFSDFKRVSDATIKKYLSIPSSDDRGAMYQCPSCCIRQRTAGSRSTMTIEQRNLCNECFISCCEFGLENLRCLMRCLSGCKCDCDCDLDDN